MIASLKEINKRLTRLKSTHKITNTMKLVAISKIKKMQVRRQMINSYYNELIRLASMSGVVPDGSVELARPRKQVSKQIFLLVVTSDRGMCGGYNHILCRHVGAWVEEKKKQGLKIKAGFYGRKGYMLLREDSPDGRYFGGLSANPLYANAVNISTELQNIFREGEYDEIWAAYNTVKGEGIIIPNLTRILPIDAEEIEKEFSSKGYKKDERLLEPSAGELREIMARQIVDFKIYDILIKNADGEQSARAVAMDNATRNVEELIEKCVLLRNRTRQAVITKELIEITSGAEVLRSGGLS